MPRYNYLCKSCVIQITQKFGRDPTDEELEECLFETRHSISPSAEEFAKAARCPDCDSVDVQIMIDTSGQSVFIRGHNWADFKKENKDAMRRDMALHQLETDDPYGYMRSGDDKAELADKLKSSAIQKPKPQYFTGTPKPT